MKAQLSFEFMVYTAIAIASISVSLSIYMYSDRALLAKSSSALDEAFAASIEAHMVYYSSTFYVVVPDNACGAAALLPKGIRVDKSLCNGSDGMAKVSLSRSLNGSYTLSGV
ncbi:MAG: hypothetical protein QXW10_04195, partial [Candidatus Micrarchaeaceae archaeon]